MKSIVYAIALTMLAGCANQLPRSELPRGEAFPELTQKKALTAKHWSLIAEDAAQRTRVALAKQGISNETPIYIAEGARHDFDRAFRKYLISHLIKKGSTVMAIPEGAVEVRYESQLIRHGAAIDLQTRGYKPGALVGSSIGFWVLRDLFSGGSTLTQAAGTVAVAGAKEWYDYKNPGETPLELILTTSAIRQNKYLMLQADAYYIEKGEEQLFQICKGNRRCRDVK